MPFIMYKIQHYLINEPFIFSKQLSDGRVNSSIDEEILTDKLMSHFGHEIIKKTKCRTWYDIKVFDKYYGWIPVNIKTTTMKTSDNTGNLAMCVYAYTDEVLDLDKQYSNGEMSRLFYEKLKYKKYNRNYKKDYYFLVLNKNNQKDVVINSIKGISHITPNLNNLPFQICWNKNRTYKYEHINIKISKLLEVLKRSPPSWEEIFMKNIRDI